jgi:hypothetical protein
VGALTHSAPVLDLGFDLRPVADVQTLRLVHFAAGADSVRGKR